jgi:hypothetical protein
LLEYFISRDPFAQAAQDAGLCGNWAWFFECGLPQHEQQRWREHRGEVLDVHVAQWRGTRPWAWWKHEAPEPRRVLVGVEALRPTPTPEAWAWVWRERLGIPAFLDAPPPGFVGVPTVEGQGTYLERLGLLRPGEVPLAAALLPEPVAFGVWGERPPTQGVRPDEQPHRVAPRRTPVPPKIASAVARGESTRGGTRSRRGAHPGPLPAF